MGDSRGASDARSDDCCGSGVDRAVQLGAVSVWRVLGVRGIAHAVREKSGDAPRGEPDFAIREAAFARYAGIWRQQIFCAKWRKIICYAFVCGVADCGDYGYYDGGGFDSGGVWNNAGSFYCVHVECVRDFGIAGDVFSLGGDTGAVAVFDGGSFVCAGVYWGEDDCLAVGAFFGGDGAWGLWRDFFGGFGEFPSGWYKNKRINSGLG